MAYTKAARMLNTLIALLSCAAALCIGVLIVFLMDFILLWSIKK